MSSNNNNKSSSLPSNPNSRNSEINPMRRSFTGNPFSKPSLIANPRSNLSHTPANSPSDFSRRSFVDDKENAKDQTLKSAKVRSPAATSKTAKNFMSPTISASFKMAESPRKKILTERNDTAPFSDPKTHVRKVTFADPLEQKMLDVSFDGDSIPFPSFEDSSDNLSGGNLCDANVVPLIPMDDLSFETKHVNVPLIPKNDTTDLSFETVHVPLIPENDNHIESSFENVSQEHDFVNLDPTFKLSPAPTPPISSTAAILDHVDADPSIPPYDPKTNYLSPRPQFLHYKPKPRMALCSHRELEDSFMSASFSDTEVTEDTQSDDSQKESDDVSSDETVMQEEEQISEPSPVRAQFPENMVEEKELRKPSFSVRSKAFALILLMLAAFVSISITNSPGIDYAVFEDYYEAYKLSEFSEFARANIDQFSQFAKENFDGLARNLHTWFTKSLSSISELMSDVRGAPHLAKLKYFNLTILQGYVVVDQCPIFGRGESEISGTHLTVQESYTASEIADEYLDDISAEHYEAFEEQLQQDMGMATGFENDMDAPAESEEVQKGQPATIIESKEQILQLDEAENLDAKLAQEIDSSFDVEDASQEIVSSFDVEDASQEIVSSFDVEDASESEEALEGQSATLVDPEQALQLVEAEEIQTPKIDYSESKPSSNSEAAEIHNEMCGEGNVDTKIAQENYANLNSKESGVDLKQSLGSDSEVAEIDMDDKASTDAAIRSYEQLLEAVHIPPHMVLCLLLCAGTVFIAGVTFNWSRKVKSRSKKITSSVKQPKIGSENKQISPDKPSLRNGPVELDVVGESCPSEMSSFQKSSSDNIEKTVNQSNEAISVEKKPRNNHRRESLASSSDYSMGSPSYGSLTVYEKILKGHGEEEIVTPVRRSSRIRSRATSPV